MHIVTFRFSQETRNFDELLWVPVWPVVCRTMNELVALREVRESVRGISDRKGMEKILRKCTSAVEATDQPRGVLHSKGPGVVPLQAKLCLADLANHPPISSLLILRCEKEGAGPGAVLTERGTEVAWYCNGTITQPATSS